MRGRWGGGGADRGSYFIPKKITASEFVYLKKSLLYLAYPKKSLSPFFATQKNPSVFFSRPKKNPGVFHRPKKITLGQNFRPKKITRTPPSLKYVSGAPGTQCFNLKAIKCKDKELTCSQNVHIQCRKIGEENFTLNPLLPPDRSRAALGTLFEFLSTQYRHMTSEQDFRLT